MTALRIALSSAALIVAIASGLRVEAMVRGGSRRGTNDREMGS